MMKCFCDYCHQEIDDSNSLKVALGGQLKYSDNNGWTIKDIFLKPTKDMCRYCLAYYLNFLDNRPKPQKDAQA